MAEDVISDMVVAQARTLALLCRHLAESRALNLDLFIADLGAVEAALTTRGVGEIGLSLPRALAVALRQPASKQP